MSDHRWGKPRDPQGWGIQQPGGHPAAGAPPDLEAPPPNYRVLPTTVDYKAAAMNPYLQQRLMQAHAPQMPFPPPQMPQVPPQQMPRGVYPWPTSGIPPGSYAADPYAAQQMQAVYAAPPPHWSHIASLPTRPPHAAPGPGARPPQTAIFQQGGKADSVSGRYNELLSNMGSPMKYCAATDAKAEGEFLGMIQRPMYRAISVNTTARPAIVLKSSVAHVVQKPPKRRLSCDLREEERWYCPFLCGKFYRKSSTVSIRTHLTSCPLRPRAEENKNDNAQPNNPEQQEQSSLSGTTQIQPDFTSLPAVPTLPEAGGKIN